MSSLRPIFIVGGPRAGTTLRQSMLATHSAIASFPASYCLHTKRTARYFASYPYRLSHCTFATCRERRRDALMLQGRRLFFAEGTPTLQWNRATSSPAGYAAGSRATMAPASRPPARRSGWGAGRQSPGGWRIATQRACGRADRGRQRHRPASQNQDFPDQ